MVGNEQIWLNPNKFEWLWLFGYLGWDCSPLILDGNAFPILQLGAFLDLQLWLEEQVVAMARMTFAKLHYVGQFHPFIVH